MTLDFKGNEKVRDEFLYWLLVDEEHGVIKFAKNKKVIQDVADLYKRKINGEVVTKEEWKDARDAAYAAVAAVAAGAYDYTAADADAYAAAVRKTQKEKLDELHALYGGDDEQ